MTLYHKIIAVLLVVAAGVVVWHFWPNEERAIRTQLGLIEATGSKKAAEPPVESLVKSKQLAGIFSDHCELTVEAANYSGTFDRKQIMDRITMVRASYSQVTVTLHDLSIVLVDKKIANVLFTIRLQATSGNETIGDIHEVAAALQKTEQGWQFTSVRLIQVLER